MRTFVDVFNYSNSSPIIMSYAHIHCNALLFSAKHNEILNNGRGNGTCVYQAVNNDVNNVYITPQAVGAHMRMKPDVYGFEGGFGGIGHLQDFPDYAQAALSKVNILRRRNIIDAASKVELWSIFLHEYLPCISDSSLGLSVSDREYAAIVDKFHPSLGSIITLPKSGPVGIMNYRPGTLVSPLTFKDVYHGISVEKEEAREAYFFAFRGERTTVLLMEHKATWTGGWPVDFHVTRLEPTAGRVSLRPPFRHPNNAPPVMGFHLLYFFNILS